MLAYEITRGMKVRHEGRAMYVTNVAPPNLENAKNKTTMMCKFSLATALDHFGTTFQVQMPFDQEVELLSRSTPKPEALKVWVYRSRNGNHGVFTGNHEGFEKARVDQDIDNNVSLKNILADGDIEVSGSEEHGHFSIDDGGSIELFEVR